MKSKGGNTARRNEDALAKRYGRIGISAVAAAARYQGKARNEASSQTKQADKGRRTRGASPKRWPSSRVGLIAAWQRTPGQRTFRWAARSVGFPAHSACGKL